MAVLLGHADSKMVEKVYGRINLEAMTKAVAPLLTVGTGLTPPALALEAPKTEDVASTPEVAASTAADVVRSGRQVRRVRRVRRGGVPRFRRLAVSPEGIEPSTNGLRVRCSTN